MHGGHLALTNIAYPQFPLLPSPSHTCTHTVIHTCMYTYIHCTYMHSDMHIHVHTCIHCDLAAHMHTPKYIYCEKLTHSTHTYTHLHTNKTHIHICLVSRPSIIQGSRTQTEERKWGRPGNEANMHTCMLHWCLSFQTIYSYLLTATHVPSNQKLGMSDPSNVPELIARTITTNLKCLYTAVK